MFFNEETAKRMHEAHAKKQKTEDAKNAPLRFLRNPMEPTVLILEGNPPLVTEVETPGETFTPGVVTRYEGPQRGWVVVKGYES